MFLYVEKKRNSISKMAKTFNRCSIFILLSFLFLWTSSVSAATINAQSCSIDHVTYAVNSAVSGDTVNVPAGNCTWSSLISTNKAITVQGAGIGQTIINGEGFNLSNSQGTRITGFTFMPSAGKYVIRIDNGGKFRLDNSNLYGATTNHIAIYGYGIVSKKLTGLIHNCDMTRIRIVYYGSAGDAILNGNQRWSESSVLGTGDTLVIEDNIFRGTTPATHEQIIDTNWGGNYTFRFNTLINIYAEVHANLGNIRGGRTWEIYKNNISNANDYVSWYAMSIRAGSGVIWDNTVTGKWDGRVIRFDNRRSYDTQYVTSICNGSQAIDGNLDSTGWPCRDQIGTSTDQWLWTSSNPNPPQLRSPAYVWNNTYGGVVWESHIDSSSAQHIKKNRDVFEQVSSFNGTSGVGRGTLASRPSTCTTGVGYWATDQGNWNKSGSGGQGILYKCTNTNKWELYYTPYEYPHPLRNGSIYNPPPESDDLTPPKIKNIEPM